VTGVGFLGYSFMGRAHAYALKRLPTMSAHRPHLVCVAGRNADAVQEFASAFDFERWTTDWLEVVADPEIDVFENLGPNFLHAEPTIAAAEAGKHVLCEKPLGMSPAQSRAMLRAVEEAGVVHMCGFNYRFMPAVRRAREMLEAGDIGEVLHFRATYRQGWGADPEAADAWRFDAAQAGGGALGDLMSHVVDLGRYLVGEIETVSAEAKTFVEGRTVDDAVAAVAQFSEGAVGVLEATRFATYEMNRLTWEVNGTKGTLAFDVERLNELWVNGRRELVMPDGWWPNGHGLAWEHSFVFELDRFLDAVAGKGAVAPHGATFHDGVRADEICDAMMHSAREGERVGTKDRPA
jgi:predicted dehydrogenase